MALARRVELDLKAGGPPGEQGAQRSIGVHEPAEPRGSLVGDAVRVAVEADGGDAHERPAVRAGRRVADHAEIDRSRDAVGDRGARRDRVLRDAEHARQIVAATAGKHAQNRAWNLPQGVGEGADHAVAAERRDRLAAACGLTGELAGVVEVARVQAVHRQPEGSQLLLHGGREAPGLAAAGGGVHDQADGRGHDASVLS